MPVLAEEPTVTLPPGHDPRLDAIERKVRDGVRLSEADGLALYETRDVHRVRWRTWCVDACTAMWRSTT
jgi:hypothetical protein